MIALAPRSCLYLASYDFKMLWFHDESIVLNSRLVKLKKEYRVEVVDRATEMLLLLLFHRIVKVAQSDSMGWFSFLRVAVNLSTSCFPRARQEFLFPKIFLSSVFDGFLPGISYVKTDSSPPLTVGAQFSTSICIVFYTFVLFRSLPLVFFKEAGLKQMPSLGSRTLPEPPKFPPMCDWVSCSWWRQV